MNFKPFKFIMLNEDQVLNQKLLSRCSISILKVPIFLGSNFKKKIVLTPTNSNLQVFCGNIKHFITTIDMLMVCLHKVSCLLDLLCVQSDTRGLL